MSRGKVGPPGPTTGLSARGPGKDQSSALMYSVGVLREAFRNLQYFRSVYETDGVDLLIGPDGIEICLWDLEYLYEQIADVLPLRQHQAIEYFLVRNLKESTVAEMMGISPTNPIGSYATAGIEKLLVMIEEDMFPNFHFDSEWDRELVAVA